jgi:hypothetical protein
MYNLFVESKGSARSVSYSQIYRVRRAKFMQRLMNFPADYERFCYLRDQVQFNKRVDLMVTTAIDIKNINCMTCQSPEHMAVDCPLSHYVPVSIENLKLQTVKRLQTEDPNGIQERSQRRKRN